MESELSIWTTFKFFSFYESDVFLKSFLNFKVKKIFLVFGNWSHWKCSQNSSAIINPINSTNVLLEQIESYYI